MLTRDGNLHLEIQTSRKSPVGLLRTSFRDKVTGKMRHTQHGRITGCSLEQLRLLQLAFREKVIAADSPDAFRILDSREWGASHAVLQILKQLGLHRILYSRNEPWVESVLAMIAGRLIYQGSKLSLRNQWPNTCLWELCGMEGTPDLDIHCYRPLDRLLERQAAIQFQLAQKHLTHGSLVLYDITSTYFEGEYAGSQIVDFGYNRDGKKGHEQIVIGLLCTGDGCPVGCEVFAGNTKDATTVPGKIAELRERYQLEKLVFVGDRGMVTQSNLDALSDIEGLHIISALTHREIVHLLEKKVIQYELFDETRIVEVHDSQNPGSRYCLCRNPLTRQREGKTRGRLLDLTRDGLNQIAAYKNSVTVETLGARVGKHLAKYKMGKFVDWRIERDPENPKSRHHRLVWNFDEAKIAAEALLDGCYIIRTDVPEAQMDATRVVRTYKDLGHVERAFRNLKTVQLEIRPVYHHKDDRIRAHVFLCVLAYYVQWHIRQRLEPLFAEDGQGKDRRWTFENVIQRLKQICKLTVQMDQVTFTQTTQLDEEQQRIAELLQVSL
jgi:transposase